MTDGQAARADSAEEDDGADGEPEVSTALRVASAIGLFLGGTVVAPTALILLAYAFAAVGADGGWLIYLDFAIVGLAGIAALVPARWRPFGIGVLVGGFFAAAVVSFYLVVLQADEVGLGLILILSPPPTAPPPAALWRT